jgi:molecular chaperone GrpE
MEEKNIQDETSSKNTDFGINADENAAGTTHLNNGLEEETEVDKLATELEEQKDKYIRLFAEFDNYRRRTAKEKIEFNQTAGKEIMVSLLDILDDAERAEKQLEKSGDVQQFAEGVLLIFNKFKKTLENKGLRSMDSLNTNFDVEKHEAITEIPVQDKSKKGKVIDEIQKGYYLNDKIIRFAKVVVGK